MLPFAEIILMCMALPVATDYLDDFPRLCTIALANVSILSRIMASALGSLKDVCTTITFLPHVK